MNTFYRFKGLAVIPKLRGKINLVGLVNVRYIGSKGKSITTNWFTVLASELEDYYGNPYRKRSTRRSKPS